MNLSSRKTHRGAIGIKELYCFWIMNRIGFPVCDISSDMRYPVIALVDNVSSIDNRMALDNIACVFILLCISTS